MSEQFNINLEMQEIQQKILCYMQLHWKLIAAEGVFFIVLGTAAIIIPQIFSVFITLFLGWLLMVGGFVQIIKAVSMTKIPGFSLWLFIGSLQTILGYFLVADPTKGAMTLTMLFAIFFALEGIAKMSLAFMMRPLARWGWVFFSGLTALLLAIIVWAGWPETALWVLGLLVGINMIFLGWSLLTISLYHKSLQ